MNNRIFVANLDYDVDENKLEEVFRLAGKVVRVRLSFDSSGASKGYGTIEYEHPVEAVQAISMFRNQNLFGRAMSIRMDKYDCDDMIDELPSVLPIGLESVGKGLGIGGQPLNVSKSLFAAMATNRTFGYESTQPIESTSAYSYDNTGYPSFEQTGGFGYDIGVSNSSSMSIASTTGNPMANSFANTFNNNISSRSNNCSTSQNQIHSIANASIPFQNRN